MLISSIVDVSTLYSKNVLGQRNLSDSFRGSLFTAPARESFCIIHSASIAVPLLPYKSVTIPMLRDFICFLFRHCLLHLNGFLHCDYFGVQLLNIAMLKLCNLRLIALLLTAQLYTS